MLLISAILLASCEKEIEFNGEQVDPKLVINSIVEPGQPVKAYISKSIFFLDNDSNMQAPDDVVATLYVNGNRKHIMFDVLEVVRKAFADEPAKYDNWYRILCSYSIK